MFRSWIEFKCRVCGNPALPVSGVYYWCPYCGWREYVNDNRKPEVY